jgi:hypothetical protein
LARLFSRPVVYFERPVGVQSAALAKICPAVTRPCCRTHQLRPRHTELAGSPSAVR